MTVDCFVARSMTVGSVPVLADTYSLLVTGFNAVRLPRSAFSVSTTASVFGSITEIVPRVDRQILDVGAGLEVDHGACAAIDDLDHPQIGKRRVRLATADVHDDALRAVRDADFGAESGGRGEDCRQRGGDAGSWH